MSGAPVAFGQHGEPVAPRNAGEHREHPDTRPVAAAVVVREALGVWAKAQVWGMISASSVSARHDSETSQTMLRGAAGVVTSRGCRGY